MAAVLGIEQDTAGDLLVAARAEREASLRADAHVLQLAATWAAMHSTDSLYDAATHWETGEAIAGDGAPLVAEFCVAEFAAAVGMTPDSGRRFLGQAVELRYRLPRCWGRVVAGDLPAWRARMIADTTMSLAPETTTYVDRHIAPFA